MEDSMTMDALNAIMEKLDALSAEVTMKKLPGQDAAAAEKPFGGEETPEEEAAEAAMGESMEMGEESAEAAVEGEEEDEEEDEMSALDAIFAKKPAK